MNKQEAAEILFFNNNDLREISKIMNISYSTLSKWSSAHNWKKKKTAQALQEETSQQRIWNLIDYQLKVIEKITEMQKNKVEFAENEDDLKKQLISKGDIYSLQLLFTTIKGKELSWDQMVKITRELVEFIESDNFNLAKEITPLINDWLNEKRTQL